MKLSQFNANVSRRIFLKSLLISGIAINFPSLSYANLGKDEPNAKVLNLFHPRTKESLTTTYWKDGNYIKSALSDIDYIMRVQYTGETRSTDKNLLDLLYNISLELTSKKPFHILSGYRCPKTNEVLRKKGWTVAYQSFHEKGMAVDIRLPGIQVSVLRRAAYKLKLGGVGYYPGLNFVHVDVGSITYLRK